MYVDIPLGLASAVVSARKGQHEFVLGNIRGRPDHPPGNRALDRVLPRLPPRDGRAGTRLTRAGPYGGTGTMRAGPCCRAGLQREGRACRVRALTGRNKLRPSRWRGSPSTIHGGPARIVPAPPSARGAEKNLPLRHRTAPLLPHEEEGAAGLDGAEERAAGNLEACRAEGGQVRDVPAVRERARAVVPHILRALADHPRADRRRGR